MPEQPTPAHIASPADPAATPGRLGAGSDMNAMFPALNMRTARRRRIRRRVATIATATIVLAATGVGIARATDTSPAGYTTVDVATRDVDSTLDGVASIEPVAGAQVAFPIAGTVTAVDVALNDAVAVGQVLATLDTTALTASLHTKQAALDKANLILTMALDGDDVSSLTGGSFGSSYRLSAGAISKMLVAAEASARPAAVSDDIAAAEQAVVAAQHDVDTDMDTAGTALSTATTVCAAISVDATATDPTQAVTGLGACQTALDAVLTAQGDVAADQATLATASTALDALLAQAADGTTTTTPAGSTTTTTPTTTTPTTTTPTTADSTTIVPSTTVPSTTSSTSPSQDGPATDSSTPDGSTPDGVTGSSTAGAGSPAGGGSGGGTAGGGTASGSASSSTPSAADLISYQKAVDAAASEVTEAEQSIAQATIVSPIAGTVVAVDLAVGDTTTAASTTQQVVIEGSGGFEATATVSLADVPDVAVGQAATVLADGTTTPITGRVVAVSLVPTSTTTTGSTTSYGVTIALDGDTNALHDGAIGSYSIVTDTSTGTLAVPTSAITTDGTNHTVTVLDGSTTTVVDVQVGVVGTMWTSISSGLTTGQHVVVADLSRPLPTSATSSSNATAANAFPAGRT